MTDNNDWTVYPETLRKVAARCPYPMVNADMLTDLADHLEDLQGGPWRIMHYDHEADDRRGEWREVYVFRSRKKAEERVDEYNKDLLVRQQQRHDADYAEAFRQFSEYEVLVKAGLRTAGLKTAPVKKTLTMNDLRDRYAVWSIDFDD